MKRHPSLAPLSRDHHAALILARLLQKGAPAYKTLPTDINGRAQYAFKFYNEELVKHFREEEKILDLVKGLNSTMDQMVQTIFREHSELHASFKSIENHPDLGLHLHKLGVALEMHIRKEERELFPLIQETCSEEQMAAIGKSLSRDL